MICPHRLLCKKNASGSLSATAAASRGALEAALTTVARAGRGPSAGGLGVCFAAGGPPSGLHLLFPLSAKRLAAALETEPSLTAELLPSPLTPVWPHRARRTPATEWAAGRGLPAAPCCRAPSPGSVPPHSLPLLLSLPWARPELWLAGGEASAEQGRGGGLEQGRGAAAIPSGTTKSWRRP